jgi:phosphoserine phosphatase
LPLAVGPAISQTHPFMLLALTLVTPDLAALPDAAARAATAVTSAGGRVKEPRSLGPGAMEYLVESQAAPPLRAAVAEALLGRPIDVALQPFAGRKKRLLIADMDSTIIGCECLDELADFAGVKPAVSAITERAMRGEIGFEGALRERVLMLKGLALDALDRCYEERVRLNPGAGTLARTMAAGGARCVLVSGGFRFFTLRVAQAAGFHGERANTLIDDGRMLTGAVGEPILGREAKLKALKEEVQALGVTPDAVLAVGDGANDLMMIKAAGLGVAYRAKPAVAAAADARIEHADLTALLYFQGYSEAEFVHD